MKRATALFLLLVLFILGGIFAWWMAVVNWWHHDDHAALGWLMLFMVLNAYLTSQGPKWTKAGHRALDQAR